jgi:hypothetical protein
MQLVPLAFIIGCVHGIKGALRSEANLLHRARNAEAAPTNKMQGERFRNASFAACVDN